MLFGQYFFLEQKQGLNNIIEEVPVQLLIDYIKQIALHHV